MKLRWALLAAAALLAACAHKTIDEGTQIAEITAPKDDKAPDTVPVVESAEVAPDPNKALENYEKLLDLPQDPVSRAETMRRLADLQLEIDEASGGTNLKESDARLRKSVALYNTVLTEQPNSPNNDRVLYQMARAYQNLGENGKAEEALLKLTQQYPQSAYIDDARFRRAELLFKLQQFDDAAVEYKKVMELGEGTPFYQSAQYKYGWAEYRQSNFENAIGVFLKILTRELPPGELVDQKAALEAVAKGKKDMSQDALRVISLSFAQLGGGDTANKYFAKNGEPPYAALIYLALGDHLLEKKRYTDSAATFESYVKLHPKHPLAPMFMTRAIAAQDLGNFIEPVVAYKEKYVKHFDPASPYWEGKQPSPEVMADLRKHLEDLARYYQARAQKARGETTTQAATPETAPATPAAPADPNAKQSLAVKESPAQIKADFETAVTYYGRLLELYPQDAKAAELRFLRAEAMYDAGNTVAAAEEYTKVVAQFPAYEKADDAAYAAVLAYQKRVAEANDAGKAAALKPAITAELLLADKYPQHPQALAALMRAGEDQYVLQQWDESIKTAERVLKMNPPAPEALRRTAWAVTSDANFSLKRYPQAEAAYTELLKLTPADSPERKGLTERLASAIYKQGEAARDAKDAKGAAAAFLRVGAAVPDATIRATADYDAAAQLLSASDWLGAIAVLEGFRARNAASNLIPDVDKKLSVAYQNAGKPKESAEVLKRIAERGGESPQVRAEAAWLAVTLLDQAKDPGTAAAFEKYVKEYPQPLDRRVEALQKLADFAKDKGELTARTRWLNEIIAADTAAGKNTTPRIHQLAAQAVLEAARAEAQKAQKITLTQPLKTSVPVKKNAMESALAALQKAADYGFADVTTAATYESGVLYQNFSQSLLKSPRPAKMGALEREQYDLLLEEQAFPIEEKAIEWHEANLKRIEQGVYTEWIGKSLAALGEMAPGKYGKREAAADLYEADKLPQPAYAEALEAVKAKNWTAAETSLSSFTKAGTTAAGPWTNLGIVHARTNRKSEAMADFTRAAQLNPKNAVALNWIGMLAREGGELARAETAYRNALAVNPSDVNAQLNLAILYDLYLKRPADALAAYKQYEALTGKKELKTTAWIAEMESMLPKPAAAPTPAPVATQAPAASAPAPAAPKPAPSGAKPAPASGSTSTTTKPKT